MCLAINLKGQSQYTQGTNCVNADVTKKTQELLEEYKKQGFEIFRGEYLTLENKTEMPIYLQLVQKKVYHIIVVGHPDLMRLEVKLGHAAFGGNEVNDQIIKNRDKTYFTHFSYTPPFTGAFLLTLYEKLKNNPTFCTSVFVLIRKVNKSTPDQQE
jgi:sugar phosphate isomerase/epimerase